MLLLKPFQAILVSLQLVSVSVFFMLLVVFIFAPLVINTFLKELSGP